ncbi:DUF3472 domain-containing protein [Dickeya lacustris]|uniref:Uncharacterized protein n=1 Tax=Dickeya lacustris TaxID=2259638 RepID=A0ABY8G6Y5_9GAMM|nr:hypothetical protein [Dickeya lacustris]WFN55702.1 hypothetical protein O1Q98_19390 [Dickeya lacustris]
MKRTLPAATLALLTLSNTAMANFPDTEYAVHIVNFTGELVDKNEEKYGDGFNKIIYPMNILSGPKKRKIYYSQAGFFHRSPSSEELYYTGLQPQDDGSVRALFSVFGKGVTTIDKHCTDDADGDPGSSCAVIIPDFQLNRTYQLIAELDKQLPNKNIWVGFVVDTSNNKKTKIGSWGTPIEWGKLSGNSIGFVEDFTGVDSCADIVATRVEFKPIEHYRSNGRLVDGKMNKAYGVGVCDGKVPFSSKPYYPGGLFIDINNGLSWP